MSVLYNIYFWVLSPFLIIASVLLGILLVLALVIFIRILLYKREGLHVQKDHNMDYQNANK